MKLRMLAPRAELTLPDGSTVEVERIGKGRYTTAWRNCSSVYLQTSELDYGKEIVARLRDEHNPHLPVCEQLESDPYTSRHNWYKMPLYKPLTAKSGVAWLDFKVLKKIRESINLGYDPKRTDDADAYLTNAEFVEKVDSSCVAESVKEAVRLLVDACCNYGAYTIEISKKNCAVDDAGNLILLDAVFDLAEVRSQWRKKSQAMRYGA